MVCATGASIALPACSPAADDATSEERVDNSPHQASVATDLQPRENENIAIKNFTFDVSSLRVEFRAKMADHDHEPPIEPHK